MGITSSDELKNRFNDSAAAIPPGLREQVDIGWSRILDTHDVDVLATLTPEVIAELPRILASSDFIARSLIADPTLLSWLSGSDGVMAPRTEDKIRDEVRAFDGENTALMRHYRLVRRREWVRLAWRDLCGHADLSEVLWTLSTYARVFIDHAMTATEQSLVPKFGHPTDVDGQICDGVVALGMGKLGGGELNFSSDIDLIFTHPEDGATVGGRREVSNQEYAIHVARGVIKLLGETTADGFVFRVDTRLRPNGDSGPMSLSFDAMEHYYQGHGREWERYALIKAISLNGSGDALLKRLTPFVYRKYLDFSAFESVRDLHARITQELDSTQSALDIKRGYGGIRQIEFIVQSYQLMRGGRETTLRTTSLHDAIEALVDANHIDGAEARKLIDNYTFLRRVEHRLQMFDDAQTHQLPKDEYGKTRLCFTMGMGAVCDFDEKLEAIRQWTLKTFLETFGLDESASNQTPERRWYAASSGSADDDFNTLLVRFHEGASWRNLSSEGRDRLDRLMPLVVDLCQEQTDPSRVLARVIRVLETIGRRTTYFAMMYEYPGVLERLIRLCAASPQLGAMLGRQPVLFDELLRREEEFELNPLPRFNFAKSDAVDVEAAMTELREYKSLRLFQIANESVSGRLEVEVEARALTSLAEIIVTATEEVVRADLGTRLPEILRGQEAFTTIAYGKLGSFELGYTSDLDVVFLYDGGPAFDAELSHQSARFAQRMISFMTTQMPSGRLYEIDTQLRPSGRSGTLVATLDGFMKYQSEDAWTWEHQALVRARAITGSPRLKIQFDDMRREILGIKRDLDRLREDIQEMRNRMQRQRDKSDENLIDLKFGNGGLVDIEFLVQYHVLAQAHEFSELLETGTTPELIQRLADIGVIEKDAASTMKETFRKLLRSANELRFMEEAALVPRESVAGMTNHVHEIWRRAIG